MLCFPRELLKNTAVKVTIIRFATIKAQEVSPELLKLLIEFVKCRSPFKCFTLVDDGYYLLFKLYTLEVWIFFFFLTLESLIFTSTFYSIRFCFCDENTYRIDGIKRVCIFISLQERCSVYVLLHKCTFGSVTSIWNNYSFHVPINVKKLNKVLSIILS